MSPPKIKCGANYINSRYAHLEAQSRGFDSAILLDRNGFVSEAPGSCIFIIKDGILKTPPIFSSVLRSITRDSIIKFSKKSLNIETIEQSLTRIDLLTADEIFLCGSAMEISKVNRIENHKIINTRSESLMQILKRKYLEIVRGMDNMYLKWLTEI